MLGNLLKNPRARFYLSGNNSTFTNVNNTTMKTFSAIAPEFATKEGQESSIKPGFMKKSYLTILISFVFWFFVVALCKEIRSGNSERVFYYHGNTRHLCTHDHYPSQISLFSELIESKSTNSIFKWCCDCIQYYAHSMGYTYEEFNIVIFVIIQPALIVFLLFWCMILWKRKGN